MKVTKVIPVPVPDVVRIELSAEEVELLCHLFGRLSYDKMAYALRVSSPPSCELVKSCLRITSALYDHLRELA